MDGWIDWLGCLADWQVDIEIDNIDVYQDAVSRSPVCTNQPVTLYPKDKNASRGVQGLVNVGTKTRFLDVSGFSFTLAWIPRIYADAFPSRPSDLKMTKKWSVQFKWFHGQLMGSSAARWPTLAGPESKVQEVQAQGHQRCPSRDGAWQAWHGETGPKLGGSTLHPNHSLETWKIPSGKLT